MVDYLIQAYEQFGGAITTGEYDRLSGYHIWTMFPLGRLARDVIGSVDNPIMTVNKMTGLPYVQLQKELNE